MRTEEPLPAELLPLARAMDRAGRAWHAYEVQGLERLPSEGAALLVFYHGFIPVDAWLFGARLLVERGRLVHGLADRWLFKTPGLRSLVELAGMVPGNREDAIRFLREGRLVGVSPGGVREAIAGKDRHYQPVWGHRQGFAHVALAAGVDLYPVFTENIEEAYRSPLVHARPFQALYERTRWPIVPVVGLGLLPFPVKLRTWIGAPVRIREGEDAASLTARTRAALQALMSSHLGPRPRMLRGLWQRLGGD